jgi:hypothetical protein
MDLDKVVDKLLYSGGLQCRAKRGSVAVISRQAGKKIEK